MEKYIVCTVKKNEEYNRGKETDGSLLDKKFAKRLINKLIC